MCLHEKKSLSFFLRRDQPNFEAWLIRQKVNSWLIRSKRLKLSVVMGLLVQNDSIFEHLIRNSFEKTLLRSRVTLYAHSSAVRSAHPALSWIFLSHLGSAFACRTKRWGSGSLTWPGINARALSRPAAYSIPKISPTRPILWSAAIPQ